MLFEDVDFDKTIKKFINYDIVWKRPYQIVSNPVFIDDDISIDDLAQGMLGNCWLISTLIILVNDLDHFIQYLNPFQSFHKTVYTGKFSFNFNINNVLTTIEIDDYLPTFHNELIFCKNNSPVCLKKQLQNFCSTHMISWTTASALARAQFYSTLKILIILKIL